MIIKIIIIIIIDVAAIIIIITVAAIIIIIIITKVIILIKKPDKIVNFAFKFWDVSIEKKIVKNLSFKCCCYHFSSHTIDLLRRISNF